MGWANRATLRRVWKWARATCTPPASCKRAARTCGVFLILSADELKDIPLKREAESLGALAKAQASGDLLTLASRGRRCVHLHLPDNSGVTLRALAAVIREILAEL